jgi:phosphomannomutase
VILPEVHPGRDAATALALLILAMQKTRKTLSSWNTIVPDFVMVKTKVAQGNLSFPQTVRRAKKLFGPNAVAFDEVDGLKTIYKESFIHIRPSGTEPIFRIFIEAPDKLTARQLLKETQAILS